MPGRYNRELLSVTSDLSVSSEDNDPGLPACIFDIDGVFLHSEDKITGADEAYRLVQKHNVPHVFVTNASGLAEKKAAKLNKALKPATPITAEQIVMAQSPAQLLFEKDGELDGKRCLLISNRHDGQPHSVAKSLGIKNYTVLEEVNKSFPRLDWMDRDNWKDNLPGDDKTFKPIEAIFILGEPLHWESQLQIILDTLLSNGIPGQRIPSYPVPPAQLPVYAVNMDLSWKAKAEQPRFGNGAFLLCLEALYKKFTGQDLKYTRLIGKPAPFTYEFARKRIEALHPHCKIDTIYGVGDNLKSDIAGMNNYATSLTETRDECGHQCQGKSVLVQTGVDKQGPSGRLAYDHAHRDFLDGDCDPDFIYSDVYRFVLERVLADMGLDRQGSPSSRGGLLVKDKIRV